LDLLTHVARNLSGVRLLIVGTYRDVEVDRIHPLSSVLAELRRGSAFQRVPLRGLTIDEVQRMVTAFIGHEARGPLAEGVHRQTEGNPLFIQEVMRYFVEEGLLKRQGDQWVGRWRETGEPQLEMVIPEGLRDVIGKRLSRLSQQCNQLLSIAAVIGRDFALETLQAVAGVSEEEVLVGLEEALKVGVVEDQSRGTFVRYRFTHAFFRQTLYEETITPRRIRLHQQVAQALESQYSARLEEHAVELGEHFAFHSDPEGLAKAVDYGEMAARRALSVFDYGEAARLLDRTIDVQEVLDPDDKSKRCDLFLDLGEALMPAGEPQRVFQSVAEEAFALAESLADRGRASRACGTAITAINRYGAATMMGTAETAQWAGRADQYAEPGTIDRVRADVALSDVQIGARRMTEGRALRLQALELALRLDDPETLFYVASRTISTTPTAPHQEEELWRLVREVAERPTTDVSATTLGFWQFHSGPVYLDWGERSYAEDLWRQVVEAAERTGDAVLRVRAAFTEVFLAEVDGHLEEAVALAERLVVMADEWGSPVIGLQYASAGTFRPLIHMGRAEEALAALPLAAQLGGGEEMPLFTARRVALLAHLGRIAEVQEALTEGVRPIRVGGRHAHRHGCQPSRGGSADRRQGSSFAAGGKARSGQPAGRCSYRPHLPCASPWRRRGAAWRAGESQGILPAGTGGECQDTLPP
jgi:hypothetical protein